MGRILLASKFTKGLIYSKLPAVNGGFDSATGLGRQADSPANLMGIFAGGRLAYPVGMHFADGKPAYPVGISLAGR